MRSGVKAARSTAATVKRRTRGSARRGRRSARGTSCGPERGGRRRRSWWRRRAARRSCPARARARSAARARGPAARRPAMVPAGSVTGRWTPGPSPIMYLSLGTVRERAASTRGTTPSRTSRAPRPAAPGPRVGAAAMVSAVSEVAAALGEPGRLIATRTRPRSIAQVPTVYQPAAGTLGSGSTPTCCTSTTRSPKRATTSARTGGAVAVMGDAGDTTAG